MERRTRKNASGPITQEYISMSSSILYRKHTWMSRWSSFWPHSCLFRSCCHSIYLSLSYSYRTYLILFLFVFVHLSSTVMARPVSDTWKNPCNINFMASSQESADSVDFTSPDAVKSYNDIVKSAEEAQKHISQIKEEFVRETFGDPEFMKEFEWLSYDWLPKIPPPEGKSLEELDASATDIRKSLVDSYEFLQKFAVAVDQMILDQIIYEGNFLEAFRNMELKQKLPLCQLQQAIGLLRIAPNPDVSKDIMSEEYRSIEAETTRNVRDYIILRDHTNALVYIAKMFQQFLDKIKGKT